ncbi:MAG: septal ring lytic transglycosylase RlpA family protein [Acidimicrobiales bacterium]
MVALLAGGVPWATPAGAAMVAAGPVPLTLAAPAGAAGPSDVVAKQNRVLLQIAAVTDQLANIESHVVSDQLQLNSIQGSWYRTQSNAQAAAVNAFIQGPNASTDSALGRALAGLGANFTASVFMAAAFAQQKADLRRYASLRHQVGLDLSQVRAEERAGVVIQAHLSTLQADLAAQLAVQVARVARAKAAAAATLLAEDQARAAAMGRSGASAPGIATGTGSATGAVASGAGHLQATKAQLALMARYPFGPIPPGAALPPGLSPVGSAQVGVASWYGPGFDGLATASGAIYDENAWTAASPDLPLGTFLVVSRGSARVLVLINDRGPYVAGRFLDLSHAAATALGYSGLAQVSAQVVTPS